MVHLGMNLAWEECDYFLLGAIRGESIGKKIRNNAAKFIFPRTNVDFLFGFNSIFFIGRLDAIETN